MISGMGRFGKSNKYGRKKVEHAGLWFDSKLEKAVYDVLLDRKEEGEIDDIRCQHTIVLQDGPQKVKISVRIDFSYQSLVSGNLEYCEAKGMITPTWSLKLKLWRKNPPGRLEIWTGHYLRPKLTEVVEPL